MTPVKNQGGCGSCWAFAVTTQLEGAIAIKNNAAPSRLSEQQLVDCTLRQNTFNYNLFGKDYGLWGCGGGWMRQSWEFFNEQGAMQYDIYPYTSGSTGVETQCAHDFSRVSQRNNLTIGRVYSTADALRIVDQVPMTIAVDASGVFQSYRSGVMTTSDGCGTGLNHAITVVGYTAAGDDGTNPPEPPTPELSLIHI